jgi:6-phospho-beta-glucosidase
MKTTILGASSQSTPALFESLARSPRSSGIRFSLVARSIERLQPIVRAIQYVGNQDYSIQCHDFSPRSLESAVTGADVVLIQIRYGGLAGRDFDETFPRRFGVCGDEGLGPGGLSAAWRSWPALGELLGLIDRLNRNTMVLLLTSPVSLLVRLAANAWPALQMVGICELPWVTLRDATAVEPETPAYDYIGINHLGWIYSLGNSDVPVPLKYIRLHYEREKVVQEQRNRLVSRAVELQRLAEAAMRAYARGGREEIASAIASRPAPWYSDSVAPLLLSLTDRASCIHFFLSVRNGHWCPEFRPEDILEIPFLWSEGEFMRKNPRRLPPEEIVTTLRSFIEYERLAASAVLSRDGRLIERALREHPWIESDAQAKALAETIVAQRVPPRVSA